jgi:hypothetical protein
VCEYHRLCCSRPAEEVLARLRALPRCDLSQCRVEEAEELDGEEGEGGEVQGQEDVEDVDIETESRHTEPEIDEDGFQMVSKKKGGRKK